MTDIKATAKASTKTATKATAPRRARMGEPVFYVRGGRVIPAIVTEVHSADCVNLVGFDHRDARTHYPTSVVRGRKGEPQDWDHWCFADELSA